MLTSIYCDKLSRRSLTFNEGLNTILGPRSGANSIGKSSVLYLIDFVFGGTSFIDKCADVIQRKGHFDIYATFEFDGICYKFLRNTESPNEVLFCVENCKRTIEEFREFLFKSYGFVSGGPSFRNLTSRFVRIWRKGNEDPEHPLHVVPTEKYNDIKDFLIKTFGYADVFEEMNNSKKKQDALKSSIDAAIKQGVIVKAGKREAKLLEQELHEIDGKINFIKNDLTGYINNIEEIINERNLELVKEKSELLETKSLTCNKILRLKRNLNYTNPINEKYFSKLIDFIPSVNIEKIKEVESFHSGIAKILKDKIKEELNSLQLQLDEIEAVLKEKTDLINLSVGVVDKPTQIVTDILTLTVRKKEIESIVAYTKLKEKVDGDLKGIKESINDKIKDVLDSIELLINSAVGDVCAEIYPKGRLYPNLKLGDRSYVFEHFNDSGTGKSYSDLMALDLAMLSITSLPVLIEDSIMFKNIESQINEKIIDAFLKSSKQIFIAMDQLSLLTEKTRSALRRSSFMRVSRKIPAFGELWNLKD
ncbi:DUF2326 domain-containing protein [Klebsiella variicola subsp. variicola]|uniref:DUF2326 domain-containing protein n=1 Tax=Klebsiella variicola TaxID=244366 RepID=UPI001BAD112D|nr:DUF2326 domain-containing protein [Klebsiella variicola]MBR7369183.1 DUF2326 domain-containing protein [Klebsiella variicola]MCE0128346.1 DUF2326 domain-containing protein [Klebsiella variicola subsp. variicola]